jgi:hypothetical protein
MPLDRILINGAHSSVVGSVTMLQARRSWDQVLMRWMFFNLPNPSSHTMALGMTQPPTEMSTTNLPGDKRLLACRADNLTAICEPTVYKMWEPECLTTLWASTAYYRESFSLLAKFLWKI